MISGDYIADMSKEVVLPSREDALNSGNGYYVVTNEVDLFAQGIGTEVAVMAIDGDEDRVVLSSITERRTFWFDRSYRRSVRKDQKDAVRRLDNFNQLSSV